MNKFEVLSLLSTAADMYTKFQGMKKGGVEVKRSEPQVVLENRELRERPIYVDCDITINITINR